MNIFGWCIIRKDEYRRLLSCEKRLQMITDRDERGRFVRR